MGARWYDPYINRWLSADTLVPDAADPQSLNRYSYVGNNPLRALDPSGHQAEPGWQEQYERMRNRMDLGSLFGLRKGRNDVQRNIAIIKELAVDYQPLVAASIAHQGSDIFDRFGDFGYTGYGLGDVLGQILKLGGASVGIAQLRTREIRDLLGPGASAWNETDAVWGMCEKIWQADMQISEYDVSLDITDRYMLLAIRQNSNAGNPIDKFFDTSDRGGRRDWGRMLSAFTDSGSWRTQLQRVLLELEWALQQGWWQLPDGLDLERWKETAFGDT